MATTAELIQQAKDALAVAITGQEVDVKIGAIEVKGSQKAQTLIEIIKALEESQSKETSISMVVFDERVDQFGVIV
jgi:hypothetical protein